MLQSVSVSRPPASNSADRRPTRPQRRSRSITSRSNRTPACAAADGSAASRSAARTRPVASKRLRQAQGIGATDLKSAYNLDTSVDPGATIAIVDAYGYSNLASDLATYRSQYGLPACTIANGCLKIVNQNGQTSPLPSEPAVERRLDR